MVCCEYRRWGRACCGLVLGACLAANCPLQRIASAYAAPLSTLDVAEADVVAPRQWQLEAQSLCLLDSMSLPGQNFGTDPRGSTRLSVSVAQGLPTFSAQTDNDAHAGAWQLGAEIQAVAQAVGPAAVGAWKATTRVAVVEPGAGPGEVSLAGELARVAGSWGAELRPILVWHSDKWTAALNPVVVWTEGAAPSLEPCGKLQWRSERGYALGLEYYAGLGPLGDLSTGAQTQAFLASVDVTWGSPTEELPWSGHLLLAEPVGAAAAGDWAVKAAVSKQF